MSVKWTSEQQQVIDLRGRNILVSAAAGSGKTAVLVERIITMLTTGNPPVSVDELLIVTFTEAAAAEMKSRIRDAIEKKLEERPDDEHLKRQATLIHNAQITTIHSFCLSVIREHFHTIDIDPGFRIGEEGELKLLRHDVLKEVLEEYYQKGEQKFLDFADSYATGKDDHKLEELIWKLYEFSRSYPDPVQWLNESVELYEPRCEEELDHSRYYSILIENVRRYLEGVLQIIEQGLEICQEEDGPYMYEDMLVSDRQGIVRLMRANGYKAAYGAVEKIQWMRLAANKDDSVSPDKAQLVKAIREEVKATTNQVKEQYFSQSLEEVLEDFRICRPMIQVFTELVFDFSARFEEKKRSQNMIDFDDMEQYALRILTTKDEEGNLVPSKTAQEYQEQFKEVMIDEYQDSNLIQEAILTSVSKVTRGEYNIFMVGDVKQSIYRFRLSRPELFMEKYDTYSTEDGQQQRIDLHRNFRSREEVLHSVNFLFEQLMTKALGGIEYNKDTALYVGADYKENEGNDTEVILIDPVSKDGTEETISDREVEARAIAWRIKDLMHTNRVLDKKTGKLRPIRYSDIVILTRSVKGWGDVFAKILMEEGIPVYAGSKEGYFETPEIGVLLDYLRVLNNRLQDIPLAAVLASSIGGLSNEELAVIKSAYPEKAFCQAVLSYKEEGENEKVRGKLKACTEQMDRMRERVPYTPLHELIWLILEETGFGDYVTALPGGEQRKANVDMLVEKARAFEKTSYKGLFHFVRYIEQLQKYEVDYGEASLEDEASDTVRIMSIHKSKGLEFPVVFVSGMGKRFNQQDARGSVVIHAELGVGLDAIDLVNRTKASSLPKKVIQKEELLESLGEELRVLYVAFTRAKEKLIITGILKQSEKKLAVYEVVQRQREKQFSFARLSGASTYWDWILPALARRTDKDKINVRSIYMGEIVRKEVEERVSGTFTRQALSDWNTKQIYDERMHQVIEEQFDYQYPYEDARGRKLKFTVSELKKRQFSPEEPGELLYEEPEVIPLLPRFMQETAELSGASRGTAYHRVMELLDFSKEYDETSMKDAIDTMKASGRISPEMADSVGIEDVLTFAKGSGGQRMRQAAMEGKLWKEQPFVLGIDVKEVYPDASGEETILVQGIIDVYFEETDGLVVLDYKTDRVSKGEELSEKYQEQLAYYARALEQITGKKVKEKIIYSFTLKEEIHL